MRVFAWRRLKLHNRVLHGQAKYGRTFVAFSELAILLLGNFELPLTLTLHGAQQTDSPPLEPPRSNYRWDSGFQFMQQCHRRTLSLWPHSQLISFAMMISLHRRALRSRRGIRVVSYSAKRFAMR